MRRRKTYKRESIDRLLSYFGDEKRRGLYACDAIKLRDISLLQPDFILTWNDLTELLSISRNFMRNAKTKDDKHYSKAFIRRIYSRFNKIKVDDIYFALQKMKCLKDQEHSLLDQSPTERLFKFFKRLHEQQKSLFLLLRLINSSAAQLERGDHRPQWRYWNDIPEKQVSIITSCLQPIWRRIASSLNIPPSDIMNSIPLPATEKNYANRFDLFLADNEIETEEIREALSFELHDLQTMQRALLTLRYFSTSVFQSSTESRALIAEKQAIRELLILFDRLRRKFPTCNEIPSSYTSQITRRFELIWKELATHLNIKIIWIINATHYQNDEYWSGSLYNKCRNRMINTHLVYDTLKKMNSNRIIIHSTAKRSTEDTYQEPSTCPQA